MQFCILPIHISSWFILVLDLWSDFPELLESQFGSNTCSFTFFATTSMLMLSFLFVIVVVFILNIGDSVKG